jgi:hypothetical protein
VEKLFQVPILFVLLLPYIPQLPIPSVLIVLPIPGLLLVPMIVLSKQLVEKLFQVKILFVLKLLV